MAPPRPKLLRTTIVQAFARPLGEDARPTAVGGRALSCFPGCTPTPPPIDLPGVGDIVGRHYRLDSLLGEGMFGKVYVAQRLDVPEHRVALKLLPRSLYAGRNVERELVMLATVGHPNVVQLKDHGTTPEYVWLTMPVYQGQTLAERLERGPLSPRQAYDVFLPIARGLEALHAAGLRHQDVKPENVYLAVFAGRVHPILLDLGVAAERDATFVAGTALYAAPEQVAVLSGLPAIKPLSERMDSYGLAATLLKALVGPRCFPGEAATDRAELAQAQEARSADPLEPGALPAVTGAARAALTAALRRWLSFEPEGRPTMRELAEQLEVLLEPEREDERRAARLAERQKTTIARLRVGVGAMLLIGAAGAGIAYARRAELRMASQLAAARRQGEESFDKLDTCVAAHRVATRETAECAAALVEGRAELRRSLDEVTRSGSRSEASLSRELRRATGRIRTLEEKVAAVRRASRASDEDAKRLAADHARARAELVERRDAAERSLERERLARVTAEAGRDACATEREAYAAERDTCKAAAKATPPPTAPPPPPPAASAPPTASPAAEPVAPKEPAAPSPSAAPRPAPAAPPEPTGAPAQPSRAPDPGGT